MPEEETKLNLKRWTMGIQWWGDDDAEVDPYENPDGKWVRYEDVVELLATLNLKPVTPATDAASGPSTAG